MRFFYVLDAKGLYRKDRETAVVLWPFRAFSVLNMAPFRGVSTARHRHQHSHSGKPLRYLASIYNER